MRRRPPQRRRQTPLSALRTFPLSGESPLHKGALRLLYLEGDRLQIGVRIELLLREDDLLHLTRGDHALLLMPDALIVEIHADIRALVNVPYPESDGQLIIYTVGSDGHGHGVAHAVFALKPDGVSVQTVPIQHGFWHLEGTAEAAGEPDGAMFTAELLDPEGLPVGFSRMEGKSLNRFNFGIAIPYVWEPSHPALYTLRLSLNGDMVKKRVGLRTTRFDPNEGFFLNGKRITITLSGFRRGLRGTTFSVRTRYSPP